LVSRALHASIALLIAIPFGAGGLCCCLFAAPRPEIAADPVSPCCAGETVPVERPSCPERDGEDCKCPAREAGLLAKPASDAGALPEAPVAAVPALVRAPAGEIPGAHAGPAVRRNPYPPPKAPIYRTLCAILC
jgi:hypothetical protein